MESAIARNLRPISCAHWVVTSPDGCREPNDISWDLPQLFESSRIPHPHLRPDNFKFEKTQPIVACPAGLENVYFNFEVSCERGARKERFPRFLHRQSWQTRGKDRRQIISAIGGVPRQLAPDTRPIPDGLPDGAEGGGEILETDGRQQLHMAAGPDATGFGTQTRVVNIGRCETVLT